MIAAFIVVLLLIALCLFTPFGKKTDDGGGSSDGPPLPKVDKNAIIIGYLDPRVDSPIAKKMGDASQDALSYTLTTSYPNSLGAIQWFLPFSRLSQGVSVEFKTSVERQDMDYTFGDCMWLGLCEGEYDRSVTEMTNNGGVKVVFRDVDSQVQVYDRGNKIRQTSLPSTATYEDRRWFIIRIKVAPNLASITIFVNEQPFDSLAIASPPNGFNYFSFGARTGINTAAVHRFVDLQVTPLT